MPTSDTIPPHDHPSSTVIHRPFGGIQSYRRISDGAARAVVHAFSMSDLPRVVAAAGLLHTPGAYAMTDGEIAYFGESKKPARRLSEHASDPAKSFARDVFVVSGCEGAPFDKLIIADFQFRLNRCAVETGVVTVWKGSPPPEPDLTDAERATHDRIFADALRLLHDAGCRLFHRAGNAGPTEDVTPEDTADAEPMGIDVSAVPSGSQEFELRYGGLWARGYRAAGRFVVIAGSEVRLATNGSVDPLTRTRRAELFAASVLAPVPGVDDRRRLTVAIAFPSTSIAAKTLAGAHSAGRWVPRDPPRTVLLT